MKSIQKKIFRQHWKVVYTFCFLQDSECDGGTMKEGKTKINEELVITRIQYRVGRTWEKRQSFVQPTQVAWLCGSILWL
jgi:hypothetical protein